jgi:hypothetical protein
MLKKLQKFDAVDEKKVLPAHAQPPIEKIK